MEPDDGDQASPEIVGACPYLRTSSGYRLGHPSRDHACDVVGPGARIRGDKQASLCLVAHHRDCQTYLGAQGLRARRPEALPPTRRQFATTLPTVLVGPPISALAPRPRVVVPAGVRRVVASQRVYQLTVTVLAILAIGLLVNAQILQPILSRSRGTPTPAAATSIPSASASGSGDAATALPTAQPWPSGAAPASATATAPRPSASPRTYVVHAGDSLTAIATRYRTTVAAIQAANGMGDSTTIHVGDVLVIP